MSPLARYIVETLITLLGVVVLVGVILYAARRRGLGGSGGPLELLGRLPLDGRRAVYLVRVGRRVLILAAGDSKVTHLGELTAEEVDALPPTRQRSFLEILRRGGTGNPGGEAAAEARGESGDSEPKRAASDHPGANA